MVLPRGNCAPGIQFAQHSLTLSIRKNSVKEGTDCPAVEPTKKAPPHRPPPPCLSPTHSSSTQPLLSAADSEEEEGEEERREGEHCMHIRNSRC